MPKESPSRSRTDYTGYEFTASAGFDYNYDPASGKTPPNNGFDPYADYYPSPPSNDTQQDHYHTTTDYGGSSRNYNRSPQRYDRSPRNNRLPQDHRTPRDNRASSYYDSYRRSGHNNHNGRRLRGSPRYDDYKDGSDDHSVEPSKPVVAPSWKTPQIVPPTPILTPTSISDDYIRESEKPSSHVNDPSSSRKLLILDLNGTLVFRSPHKPRYRRNNHSHNHKDRTPSPPHDPDPYADPFAIRPLREVHPRPYLTPFREYLFHPFTREWLDTMVWSSAQPHSVADMVEKCFGEKKDDLVAIWARDTLGLAAKDYNRKTQTTKDLAKPWASLPLSSSKSDAQPVSTSTNQIHSARTTILLDDSPLKAHLQPYNHLCIREYVAELRNADIMLHSSEGTITHENEEVEEKEISLIGNAVEPADLESPITDKSEPDDADETTEQQSEPNKTNTGSVNVTLGKRKRRRRPKHKKKLAEQEQGAADQPTSPTSLTSTPTYDQTLLAVIGILDTIKHESNIAGWMRGGGLFHNRSKGKRRADPDEDDTLNSSPQDGRELKRTRISAEATGIHNHVVTTSLDTQIIKHHPINVEGEMAAQTDAEQWYENLALTAYWVRRGIKALEKLAITITPGVEA